MHISNRAGLLLGIMFVATLGVTWIWLQDFPQAVRWWATWCLMCYGVVAGFLAWEHGLRHKRLIQNIPTSEIATAAQGYVELQGKAEQFENQAGRHTAGLPVLWYRKEFAERADISDFRAFPFNLFYTPVATEESRTPFAIVDQTGAACILPHGADIIVARKNRSYLENRRVTDESILPGDPLYVMGIFSTHTPAFPYMEKLEQLLGEWDRDPVQQRQFDRNRDGRLSPDEWREMHLAAQMAVAARQNENAETGQRHLVYSPADGRRFIISTLPPEKLAGHYLFYLCAGLILLATCLPVLAAMTLHRLF